VGGAARRKRQADAHVGGPLGAYCILISFEKATSDCILITYMCLEPPHTASPIFAAVFQQVAHQTLVLRYGRSCAHNAKQMRMLVGMARSILYVTC
jgi:hypothetical protein